MSRDPRIDAYIAKAQPFARPILDHVRERVHAVLPDVEEAVKWSMPAYTLGGKIVLITAAFKAHMALNFWRGQELRGEAANADAMGQFGKVKSLDELPSDAELDRADPRSRRTCEERAGAAQGQARAQAAAGNASRIRRGARQGAEGQGGARRLSALGRSATISNGSPRRSRTPRGKNASPPPSNGSAKASAAIGSMRIAEGA